MNNLVLFFILYFCWGFVIDAGVEVNEKYLRYETLIRVLVAITWPVWIIAAILIRLMEKPHD